MTISICIHNSAYNISMRKAKWVFCAESLRQHWDDLSSSHSVFFTNTHKSFCVPMYIYSKHVYSIVDFIGSCVRQPKLAAAFYSM